MSNSGLEFSTAINMIEIAKALDYGKENLDEETYNKVVKAFKTLLIHTLIWILISIVVGFGIVIICKNVSDSMKQNLMDSYNATNWESGIKVNSTTVQYTRGQSYRFDASTVGVDLDKDFPNQRSLTLLLDDNNTLKGIISNDEFNKLTNIFAMGIVLAMVAAVVIMVGYAIYVRKHAPYAKIWYAFMHWVNTGDESLG
jgi:hypothetical protein